MATINYTTTSIGTKRFLIQWVGLGSSDTAQPYDSADAELHSIQSERDGAGTNGILKGSNSIGSTPGAGSGLLNLFGGIVLGKPTAQARWYFPEVFEGAGTLTVTLLFEAA